jgi:ABC-2 type transport system permease protein
VFNRTLGYQQYVVPAVFLFILHQTLLIGLGLRGASEYQLRQVGPGCSGKAWPRLLARTLLFMALYLGFTLFYFGPCFAWYGLNRLADPLLLLGFLLPFFLALTQLGILFGSYLTRREMATPIIVLSSLPLLFAVGFIWPQEMLPWPIKGVMTLLPATPGILGSLRLNGMGGDWSAVSGLWGQMWLQALGYGLLAWWRLRRQLRCAATSC